MNTKIIAAAVAGVFAVGAAVAADVNVYGKVDLGVHYKNVEHGEFGGSTDSFSIESGQNSASRSRVPKILVMAQSSVFS